MDRAARPNKDELCLQTTGKALRLDFCITPWFNHITLPQMELIALPNSVKQNKTSNRNNWSNLVPAGSAGNEIILLLFLVIDALILQWWLTLGSVHLEMQIGWQEHKWQQTLTLSCPSHRDSCYPQGDGMWQRAMIPSPALIWGVSGGRGRADLGSGCSVWTLAALTVHWHHLWCLHSRHGKHSKQNSLWTHPSWHTHNFHRSIESRIH